MAFWDLNSGERNRVLDISTLGSSMRTKVLQSTNGTVQTNIDATFISMHETPNGVFILAKTSAFTWRRLRPRPRLIPIRMELGLLIMLRVVTVDLGRDRHQCKFPLVLYTFYRYWSQYRYISVGQCKGTIRSLLKATARHRSAFPKPVSAQPCVGKLGISLVLLNFLGCNFRLWFETP